MEKLLSVVFYMLTLTEFFLFYYTFFWKKLRVLDWKMRTVQVGLLVLPGIGVWKEWNREIQLYLVLLYHAKKEKYRKLNWFRQKDEFPFRFLLDLNFLRPLKMDYSYF